MSLLDHPEAQALLTDAVVTPDAVRDRADRLTAFLQRYLPRFYRVEQRATGTLVIRGRLGGQLFLWARAAYAVIYLIGIPYLRTLAWLVSVIGLVMIFLQLL